MARQHVVTETLLTLSAVGEQEAPRPLSEMPEPGGRRAIYEFLPSPESILEEVVPASFKVKLFKCFLDSAVSEQIARMVAMKNALEGARLELPVAGFVPTIVDRMPTDDQTRIESKPTLGPVVLFNRNVARIDQGEQSTQIEKLNVRVVLVATHAVGNDCRH